MEQWAEELINQHRKPITKFAVITKKLFIPKNENEEKQEVKALIQKYCKVLNVSKVERRCGRSKINWLNNQNLGIANKIVGPIFNTHGFQNSDGHYLLPEEILFLLEKNRIELFWNSIPVSVEQAYMVLLTNDLCLHKYRSYKNFVQQGIKVVDKYVFFNKIEKVKEPVQKKVKTDETNVLKGNETNFSKLFQNLQRNGPQMNKNSLEVSYDYKVFLPSVSKKEKSEFNYKILSNDEFDPKLAFIEQNSSILTCFPTDSYPCYKIVCFQTPNLF